MTSFEKRYPRKTFEKKLIKICSQLDLSCERNVEYKDYFRRPTSNVIKISSLWVVGSFARGATECGDLDLVIQLENHNSWNVHAHDAAKSFFGTLPLVRYYKGTPQENTSGVPFHDAVEIWSGPGSNWRKKLDSIELNPNAGRAMRETDCILLRDEQIHANPDWMKLVASMINDRLLESEFFPFDHEMLKPLSDEELQMSNQWVSSYLGKKSQKVWPGVVRLMNSLEPNGRWFGFSTSALTCGGSQVSIGRPALNVHCLLDDSLTRQLVLVPHFSSRGPNGAWIIRRGSEHSDIVDMADKYAFTIGLEHFPARSQNKARTYNSLALFSTTRDAQEASAHRENPMTASQVSGTALLDLICQADAIEIGYTSFALNHYGQICLSNDIGKNLKISGLQEVIQALPSLSKLPNIAA